ncbi:hypothetical protein [Bacillus subtilis]|uniref:hypothetical protein n=1 Tax=Bacillus subtilis TaxID=1423 RepID=UPI002939183C|nr:hypothetical protein [Bacillus subtilis]WNA14236.1 hypothetical protein phi182_68 [Bacillus phage phi18-2]WOF29641.1 hypothetical protein OEJ84_17245 [Bacillus subtilis]
MTYLAIGCLVALFLLAVSVDVSGKSVSAKVAKIVYVLLVAIPLAVLVADVC